MVRRKIKIKKIEDASTRQVTFSKRRAGLLKKASDLSVLCDAEVGVVIFSSKGKLFEFASSSMESVLDRYLTSQDDTGSSDVLNCPKGNQTDKLQKNRPLHRDLLSDDLAKLSLEDLMQLEQQINDGLGRIRAKKGEVIVEQLEEIKEKVADCVRTTRINSNLVSRLAEVVVPRAIRVQLHDQRDTAERSILIDDLNKSPRCEEYF